MAGLLRPRGADAVPGGGVVGLLVVWGFGADMATTHFYMEVVSTETSLVTFSDPGK